MTTPNETATPEDTSSGWTGGRDAFGNFAPGMVHDTDQVLFDEVWERPDLTKRDRSLLQLAFYAGWPSGMGATTVLQNVIDGEAGHE